MKCQFRGCHEEGITWKATKRYFNKHFYLLKKRKNTRNMKLPKICVLCKESYLGINRQKYCKNCKEEAQRITARKNTMKKNQSLKYNKKRRIPKR